MNENRHNLPLPDFLLDRVDQSGAAASVPVPVQGTEPDDLIDQIEQLVVAVIFSPPPAFPTRDPDWLRLFRWCESNRVALANRVCRRSNRPAEPRMGEIWLLELATPPKGTWDGVRQGVSLFIRLAGLPPRYPDQPLFTGSDEKPPSSTLRVF